jgi:hypothetical protein
VKGIKSVAAGMNPMDLKRGLEKAVSTVCVEGFKNHLPKPVKTNQQIEQVGFISANGDSEIAQKLGCKPWKKSVKRASSQLKKPSLWKQNLKSWKACNLTVGICHHTL